MSSLDEPNMSDTTILVSVEDLISMAMGPPDRNRVDFKMIQTVLYILARQLRLLEQKVVLQVGPLPGYTTSQSTLSPAKGKVEKKAGRRPATKAAPKEGKDEARGKRRDSDEGRREEKRSKSVDAGKTRRKHSTDEESESDGKRRRGDDKQRSKSVDEGKTRKKRSTDEESESDGKRRRGDDKQRSKSVDAGRDEARASRKAETGEKGGKDEEQGGKRGKDGERGGKADKDVEKGAKGKDSEKGGKGGKDEEKGRKGGKDEERPEKGGKRGKDEENWGKGGKGEERPEKGGKVGKDVEKGGKGGKDEERPEKVGKDAEMGGKAGSDEDRGGKRGKVKERGGEEGKDEERGGKGGKYEDRGGKGGKDEERPEKGGKVGTEAEKGGKGGKDEEMGGKGGKDEERPEKGGKVGKDEERGGERGKDKERPEKGEKVGTDAEKGGKGGKDEEKGGKVGKDEERPEKGGKVGKDAEKGGKGGKDEERPEKGGKVGKAEKDVEKGGKSKDTETSEKGDKDAEKGGKDKEKGGKGETRDEEGKGGKYTEKGSKGEKRDKDDEKGGQYKETGGKGGKDKLRPDAEEGRPGKDKEKGGIGIKEVTGKGKEKLLVVEKSSGGARPDRRGSIAVVTQSQFALLQAAVEQLEKKSLPPPPPAMPGNEKLRSDLASGSATLTDAMQALQVAARVQAAEQAIGRLGGLLTSLAGAGALPDDEDDDEEDMGKTLRSLDKRRPSTTSRKSVMIQSSRGDMGRKQSVVSGADAGGGTGGGGGGGGGASLSVVVTAGRPSVSSGPQTSTIGRPSTTSRASLGQPLVTQADLSAAMAGMRQDLMKNMQAIVGRAQAAADASASVAKSIGEKLDLAARLNSRISSLNSLVGDYADQLAGFDAGLTTQMMSFQEQMAQMRKDLATGLAQFDNANNNAETAAVMELTERYDLLVMDLDRTLLAHQALTTFQQQLSADFRALYLCVEMLREQKADRDEVLDGLRDKADNERLAGLLREEDFNQARSELEMRLELCHEKFRKQDNMWVTAIKDLTQVVQTKAELMDLLKTREETTEHLQAIQDMIKKLALVLGEPKAAMLMRKLARDAQCGVCLVPALMEPEDAARGAPPRLPALPARGAPVGAEAEAPCEKPWKPPQPPDLRSHKCHRWVGGSHTMMGAGARATPAQLELPRAATRKYTGSGYDGRLYMMEVELEPCVECNPLEEIAGGGDSQPLGTMHHGVEVVGAEACACADNPKEDLLGKELIEENREKLIGKAETEPVMEVEEKGDGEQIPVTEAISFVKAFGKA